MTGTTSLYQRVLAGSYDNHVLPFLWQKGESRETIIELLDVIAASDIREICLESRTHPEFCKDGWWEDLGFIIDECKKRDIKIWILDDAHFPTGYANGALAAADMDLKKTVLKHRVFDVVGPTPESTIVIDNPFDPTEQLVGAAFMQGGESIDVAYRVSPGNLDPVDLASLTSPAAALAAFAHVGKKPAQIVFDAPAGLTQVHVLTTSVISGFRDEYINMVDERSVRVLIDAIYEPHFKHFGEEFGKTILGFFTDEPGFMNAEGRAGANGVAESLIGDADQALPWSEALSDALRDAFGDTYLENLSRLWDRGDRGAHARHAYMDEATRLYSTCFDQQLGAWCRDHGVMHIGHVIEDKGLHTRLGEGAGHYFRAIAGQDMAGVDIVLNQLLPGMDEGLHSFGRGLWDMEFFNYALAKLGSSAAHIDPLKQGRCMAEVFGAFGWHEGLKEMKWICDHFLVRGVNWFVPHAFTQAPFPDFDCPPHFYAQGNNPQFAHFGKLMTYVNRMSTLLSGGTAHPVCAVLYHADAEWAGQSMPIQRVAKQLARNQIDFDFIPADVFADNDRYVFEISDDGTGFTVNGQPYRCLVIPRSEFIGSATLAAVRQLEERGVPVYAVDDVPTRLYDGTVASEAGWEPVAEAERMMTVCPLENLARDLRLAGLTEVNTTSYEPWLRAMHYTNQGEDYYLFVNEHPKLGINTTVAGIKGVKIDLFTGELEAFDEVLNLSPYESCLVVQNAAGAQVALKHVDSVELEGPWSVSYASATDQQGIEEGHSLTSLVNLSATLYPAKTGIFRYTCTFSCGNASEHAIIDLGEVYETAEVNLDGRSLGVRIAPPYTFPTGALSQGPHHLVVDVINTLDKSVGDMFSTTEVGEPSGMLGPVHLYR